MSIKSRRFGTLCRFHLQNVVKCLYTYTLHHLLRMEPTQSSETSAFNTQTSGKYPEDNLSLLQHDESLKTRNTPLSSEMILLVEIQIYNSLLAEFKFLEVKSYWLAIQFSRPQTYVNEHIDFFGLLYCTTSQSITDYKYT
jgi:hypothetical protein